MKGKQGCAEAELRKAVNSAIKKNSFMARIIACAPNHNSYKHHASKRDYLSYLGPGAYTLNDQYKEKQDLFQNVNVQKVNTKEEPV